MNDRHMIELLPAYALGCLDGDDASQVAAHVASCLDCRSELTSYEAVAGHLALAAPDGFPPAGLKQQILGQLQTPGHEPAAPPRLTWWQQVTRLHHRAGPAWGVASLALVVLLVVSNLWWWLRTDHSGPITTPGGMQVVAMVGTDAAPDAVGTLVISGDGEYGTLAVDGLPALDEEHQYQLWLIRDGRRTSGGVFPVNSEGYGALWVSSPEPLSSYSQFGITIEPAGGSSDPTGDKVLGGSL